eukprot:sb/3471219/
MPASGSKLWREEGKVTPVKNQGSCGSCWTFGGTAAFEGHYAIKSGGLKRFSEQEILDCTYEGMIAASMVRTVRPRKSSRDANLVAALNVGPVAMAFEIKGGFSYYKKGVLTVKNCGKTPHHAMAVTGYTPEFFEIKNSWGANWGDRGYVRFSRKIENMCGISNWNAYPELKKTGDDDSDPTDAPNPTG